ncbi:hypothetical protein GUITHDRAFT_66208, partial [Guillardia theta CCMP2712]
MDPNSFSSPCPCTDPPQISYSFWSQKNILAISVGGFACVLLLLGLWIFLYVKQRQQRADAIWEIRRDELHIAEPPDVLGYGAFGLVVKANYRGTSVAVKRVLPASSKGKRDSAFDDFIEEMRTLSKLRHPCIVTLMGAVVAKEQEPLLVMELMVFGSLYDLIHNETARLEGELVVPILNDVAQGVKFLHAATPFILHGDLKAQNILVDSSFRGKVSDFGLSHKVQAKSWTLGWTTQVQGVGTPFWMAPELLNGEKNTIKTDTFAFGILLWEVYSRQEPYDGEDLQTVLKEVADLTLAEPKRPKIPPNIPKHAVTLMEDCWHNDPATRPTFNEI